jgi:hypothetical protein
VAEIIASTPAMSKDRPTIRTWYAVLPVEGQPGDRVDGRELIQPEASINFSLINQLRPE